MAKDWINKMTRDEILNMPAGREMDVTVGYRVMDLVAPPEIYPNYSTDISAAWEVVTHFTGEKCDECDFFIECWSDGEWFVSLHPLGYSSRDPKASCDGRKTGSPSAPLAICRAALLAAMEQEE